MKSTRSRVFVVQMPHQSDGGTLTPRYDIDPAGVFGELVYLLGPNAKPFMPASPVKELHEKLHDFCDDDYLLLIGNPCLIGWATAIAADYNDGKIQMLQWDGRKQNYTPVTAVLFDGTRDRARHSN